MVYEKHAKLHNTQNVNFYKNMPKSEIHPKWFEASTVLCDGKSLCLIGSTKRELQIDISNFRSRTEFDRKNILLI